MNKIVNPFCRSVLVILSVITLSSCVSGPQYDQQRFDSSITPEHASTQIENLQDTEVMWGGILIANNGVESGSRLEVLAYPLKSNQQPDLDQSPVGRFIALEDRFLEPLDYAEGRQVTVTGRLVETREGKVGEANYVFPIVQSQDVYLWSPGRKPEVNFGVGFVFGF